MQEAFENSLMGIRASIEAGIDIVEVDVDYYTAHHGMLSHDFVRRARQDNKGIWIWTVNTEEAVKEVLQYDIDGIITKQPLLVKEILGRRVDEDLIED